MTSITVEPITATLGAEVSGFDMADVDDATLAEIRDAWMTHKVLVLRDQHVSTEDHIAFGARFGELELHPFTDGIDEHPEIVLLEAGGDSGKSFVAAAWHSDVTWRAEPSMGSILRGREVPDVGGDTCFADATAAYERLSDDWKELVDDKFAIHDYARVFGGRVPKEEREAMAEKYPPQRHPVIRTHPETGKRGIYTNIGFTSHIEGVSDEESKTILSYLERAIMNPSIQMRVRWKPDTFVMWDNRAVQHSATDDFFPPTAAWSASPSPATDRDERSPGSGPTNEPTSENRLNPLDWGTHGLTNLVGTRFDMNLPSIDHFARHLPHQVRSPLLPGVLVTGHHPESRTWARVDLQAEAEWEAGSRPIVRDATFAPAAVTTRWHLTGAIVENTEFVGPMESLELIATSLKHVRLVGQFGLLEIDLEPGLARSAGWEREIVADVDPDDWSIDIGQMEARSVRLAGINHRSVKIDPRHQALVSRSSLSRRSGLTAEIETANRDRVIVRQLLLAAKTDRLRLITAREPADLALLKKLHDEQLTLDTHRSDG